MSLIEDIFSRQVLDSRGNPTIEVDIFLESGAFGSAIVPSGASTGSREALELRDNDKNYMGRGVQKAIRGINEFISKELRGISADDQRMIDNMLIDLDGTSTKSNLGANALLGVSLATARAMSVEMRMPLYRYIGGMGANLLPLPMANILNGGLHADSTVELQEFMIIPNGFDTYSQGLQAMVEIFHHLKLYLKSKNYSVSIGDEGGFAPNLRSNEEAIDVLLMSIEKAGYNTDQIKISIDAASSELYSKGNSKGYNFWKSTKKTLSTDDMIDYWTQLVKQYPMIVSIEDPLDENDWNGWKFLTEEIGDKVQIVGDDLFVTNEEYLQKGIEEGIANSILIKLNQIGTLTETMDVIEMAKNNDYSTIISHRSGESEDVFIADLSVALNAGQIKTGSLCRSDRVAKYNQLTRIEEDLGSSSRYMGFYF